jgi:hypothetical protein
MAEETSVFNFDLKSQDVGGSLKDNIAKLAQLKETITADVAALRDMKAALRNLKGGAETSGTTLAKLKDEIKKQEARIRGSQEAYLKLGGTFKAVAKSGKETVSTFDKLKTGADATGGPLSRFLRGVSSFKSLLGSAGFVGIAVAAVAAFALLTVATVGATVAMTKFGLSAANTARAERLQLEGANATAKWMMSMMWGFTRATDSAESLQSMIDQVSSSASIGRDKIAGYEASLLSAGLRGKRLQTALEAVAIAASGDETGKAAEMVKGMAVSTAYYGGSLDKLANKVKATYGGIVAKKLLDLNVQTMKLKQNMSALFRDMPIEGALKGLKTFLSVFDQTTVTGQTLKYVVNTIASTLLGLAPSAGSLMKVLFQEMIIATLNVMIAVQQLQFAFYDVKDAIADVKSALRATFDVDNWGGIDALSVATEAARVVFWGLAVAAGAVALGMIPIVIAVGAVGAAAWLLYRTVKTVFGGLIDFGNALLDAWSAVFDKIFGLFGATTSVVKGSGSTLGRGFAEGLTKSLRDSIGGEPAKAANELAGSISDAASSKLEVRSPSRVGFRIGKHFGVGLSIGQRSERGGVARASASLVAPMARLGLSAGIVGRARLGGALGGGLAAVATPPSPLPMPAAPSMPATARAPGPTASRAPSKTVGGPLIGELHLHGEGTTAKEFVDNIETELGRVFERLALQLGATLGSG